MIRSGCLVSDWQMTEEAQRAALAALVHAISRLDTTLHWGEGRTSASDGQRFAMPRRVLHQTYSTRFSAFALEFYSFVADNYAPFYSMPIECTDRDTAFVLDELLTGGLGGCSSALWLAPVTDAAEALDAAAQTRLGDLRKWLTKQMRTIRLPDLLIEVDNDLRFTDHFVPPAQRGGRDAEDVCTLLAVVLAHGCNIGLHTMAQITQGVTYKQLKRVSDWQMTEEAQRAALAALVHAISRLDTTIHWGDGRTSASDGQRFAMPRKVLRQTYSTRFSDFALEF